jgi:hypothetical protein
MITASTLFLKGHGCSKVSGRSPYSLASGFCILLANTMRFADLLSIKVIHALTIDEIIISRANNVRFGIDAFENIHKGGFA